MEKYEAPKLEVIEMQNDVILCSTGGCPSDCGENCGPWDCEDW